MLKVSVIQDLTPESNLTNTIYFLNNFNKILAVSYQSIRIKMQCSW